LGGGRRGATAAHGGERVERAHGLRGAAAGQTARCGAARAAREPVMPREAVAFLMFVTMVGGFVLLYPLVRALAERLRPRPEAGKDELEALRDDWVQEQQAMRRGG